MRRTIVSKTVVSVAVLIVLMAGPAFAAVNIETVPVGDPATRAILYSGVDPRIEPMSVLFRLAGNNEYNQHQAIGPTYDQAIDRYFAPCRDHEDVQFISLPIRKGASPLDELEQREDLQGIAEILADARKTSNNAARALRGIHTTKHVQVRYSNVPEEYARAAAALYEVCDASLRKRFAVKTGICRIPGKKLHLHLLAKEGYQLNLWTDPTSVGFPLVIETMPNWRRGLSSPDHGGPHIVYGLCHELGHVLMGWEDCRHQWADYLGSLLVEDVASELGAEAWPQPYDIRAEGLKRFLKKIEGVKPDRRTDSGTARMFYDVGESFGLEVWGKALDWIKKNRRGKPFYATRLYRLNDLRDALLALGRDPKEVQRIFGGSKRGR